MGRPGTSLGLAWLTKLFWPGILEFSNSLYFLYIQRKRKSALKPVIVKNKNWCQMKVKIKNLILKQNKWTIGSLLRILHCLWWLPFYSLFRAGIWIFPEVDWSLIILAIFEKRINLKVLVVPTTFKIEHFIDF